MRHGDKIENTVVCKSRPMLENEDKGLVEPLISLSSDGTLLKINKSEYPSEIFVSNGYSNIDNTYEDGELFLLDMHIFDEDKTKLDGINRFWTEGKHARRLTSGTLIPVIRTSLPDESSSRLNPNINTPKDIFFIFDVEKNKIFGTFSKTDDNENGALIEPRTSQTLSYSSSQSIAEFDYEDIKDLIIEIEINGSKKTFISSLKNLGARTYSSRQYMNNTKLINYFNNLQFGRKNTFLSKNEAKKLKEGISNLERQNISLKNNPQIERLKSLLEDYLNDTDSGYQIIRDFFDSSKGKSFLESYVKENESTLISNQIKKFESDAKKSQLELNSKIEQLETQINKKQSELKNINEEVKSARENANKTIELIEKEAEEARRERIKTLESDLQIEIEELEEKRDTINKEITELVSKQNIANNIEDLNIETKVLNREILRLGSTKKELEDAVRGFENALDPNKGDLASKVGELAVVSRVLKGGSSTIESQSKSFNPLIFASTVPTSAEELVDAVRSSLDDDLGKSFSDVDMANILLSTTQSFLTVLSGPPGVGKTSSVVRLAKALNLGNTDNNQNFLYMPVARGWVSGRDILGFYNSLNNTYQRARTGLYDFLNNPVTSDNDSLRLVLLDEANLSPMEHYWSDFIGMCDQEGRNRPIVTGRPEDDLSTLNIPKQVRFIATVNHDATTERLSPRLIDRAAVISLDYDVNAETSYSSGVQLDGALQYELFEKYFSPEDPELSSSLRKKLNDVINTLSDRDPNYGTPISISHRKFLAIENFYSAATQNGLMDSNTAFDFALSQHILPHIDGYGSKFRTRIQNLKSEIGTTYSRTNKHLERILASGNDMTGTYSFF